MLYLFNSAYRVTYVKNVLNTLHFPIGMENEFEYSSRPDYNFVHDSAANTQKDEKVLITFIDRQNEEGFIFYPLRVGTFKSTRSADGKTFFKVVLGVYCTAKNVEKFNEILKKEFSDRIFTQTQGDEGNGYFAFQNTELNILGYIAASEDNWASVIHSISKCKRFVECASVFTKLSITDKKGNRIAIKNSEKENYFILKTKEEYDFNISYILPDQAYKKDFSVSINIESNPNIFMTLLKPTPWGVLQGESKVKFHTINRAPKNKAEVRFCVSDSEKIDKDVYIASKPIFIKLRNKPWRWLGIILCVLFIALSSWIMNLQIDSIIKESNEIISSGGNLCFPLNILFPTSEFLKSIKYFYPIVFSGGISIATFFLVRLYGKND